ncbi:hypothetical protein GGI35DRAFT_300420 [Trichoderma velutinum]
MVTTVFILASLLTQCPIKCVKGVLVLYRLNHRVNDPHEAMSRYNSNLTQIHTPPFHVPETPCTTRKHIEKKTGE